MKLDSVTIPIERRTIGESIDLGVRTYQTDFLRIAGVCAAFVATTGAIQYCVCRFSDHGLLASGVIFYLYAPLLGAALVAMVGPRAFGDDITTANALRVVTQNIGPLFLSLTLPRLLLTLLGAALYATSPVLVSLYVPLLLLASGHVDGVGEVVLLEGLRGDRFKKRVRFLRSNVASTGQNRFNVGLFYLTSWWIVFLSIDILSGLLFSFPLLTGRLTPDDPQSWKFVVSDARFVVSFFATGGFLYPLLRLPLFFVYLEQRIQTEGWDAELALKAEAERLKTST